MLRVFSFFCSLFSLLLFLSHDGRGRAPSAAAAPRRQQLWPAGRFNCLSSRRLGLPGPGLQEHQPVLLVSARHRPLRRALDPRRGVVSGRMPFLGSSFSQAIYNLGRYELSREKTSKSVTRCEEMDAGTKR